MKVAMDRLRSRASCWFSLLPLWVAATAATLVEDVEIAASGLLVEWIGHVLELKPARSSFSEVRDETADTAV